MSSSKARRRNKRRAEKTIDEAWEALHRGELVLAERLSRRAVDQGPMNTRFWKERGEILAHLGRTGEARAAQARAALLAAPRPTEAPSLVYGADRPPPVWTRRTEAHDWGAIAEQMRRRGVARIPAVLDDDECAAFRAAFVDDAVFEWAVALDDERGRVRYRFFRRPLPPLIVALRTELYARAAIVANEWEALLRRDRRYPLAHRDFLDDCERAGHGRTSVLLLRYEQGGFNALHYDAPGRIRFPLQCAITLGPNAGAGGAFVLADERPGAKKRVSVVETAPGDAVLFATRERLVRVGERYGLQAVRHGVREITAPERYALGLPFHDYPGPITR